MPTVTLGPDGRPIVEMFPGGQGLPHGYMPGLVRPAGYVQPGGGGGGAAGGGAGGGAGGAGGAGGGAAGGGGAGAGGAGGTGAGGAGGGAAGQTSVFTPTPANYLNPWLSSVTAGVNNQPVSFARPGAPNPNYATTAAAGQLAKDLGANLVTQNMTGMSSPGSPAPSAPMMGLDFGRGDVQGADVGLTGIARGDSPESIAARYQAGLNTKAWAGSNPVPVTNPSDNTFWNRTTPAATNTPNAAQAGFFAPKPQPNVAPVTGGAGGSNVAVQQLLAQLGLVPPAQALSGPQMNVPPGGIGGFFT